MLWPIWYLSGGKWKRAVARPSLKTEKIIKEIVDKISLDVSLAEICRADHMPTETTVYRWLADDEEFRKDYMRARENQGHTVADKIGELRKKVLAGEVPADAARVAADLMKWESGKRAAKYYGDAMLHKHADADGEKLPIGEVERVTRLAALASQIQGRQDAPDNAE